MKKSPYIPVMVTALSLSARTFVVLSTRTFKVLSAQIFAVLLAMTFIGCSSNLKKADIPSSANPQEEISKLESEMNSPQSRDTDVLAAKQYKLSEKWLNEAKSDLASNQDQEEILNDLRYAKGALIEAQSTAQERRTHAPAIFEARKAAIASGAHRHPELKDAMKDADEMVINEADSLSAMKPDQFSRIQGRYIDLERRGIILTQLGSAQSKVIGARENNAVNRAPDTLQKAETDLKDAQNVVAANIRNPSGFAASVDKANRSSDLLMAVMATIKQNGKNLSEAAALKMVSQSQQIANLKTDLSSSEANQLGTQAELNAKNRALNRSNQNLDQANQTISVQQALESARKEFSPEEAEAYQQGDNLVIRLKSVNFPVGRSDLPAGSLAVLAKVADVAKNLQASEIKVEGHTDSMGAEKMNQRLSKERASAVATYFLTNGLSDVQIDSEGYGFSRPLATNKSKAGRAQNRRVDIVITPVSERKSE